MKIEGSLTFLTVGLTGTGKSELCLWMTADSKHCKPSSSTTSNTSEVIRVKPAFGDPKRVGRPLSGLIPLAEVVPGARTKMQRCGGTLFVS